MNRNNQNIKKNPIIEFFADYIKAIVTFHKQTKPDGKILEAYNKGIITKDEYNDYIRSNHPYHLMKKNKSGSGYFVLGIFLLALLWYYFMYMPIKAYITVDDFSTMGDPIQIPATGSILREVEGETIEISYLYEYTLSGRVLATAQYGNNIFERLLGSFRLKDDIIRYKDVGIGWGFLTEDDYVKRFKWKSYYRWLLPEAKSLKDRNYVSQKYNWDDIGIHMSHNHLIPADDRVKKLLRGIQKGQDVQITGYLVALHGNRGYSLVSSTVRDDSGDGACETIYVTDVKWLKEK